MEVDPNALERCRWVRVNWKWGQIGSTQIGIFLRFNPVVTFLSAAIIWFFVIWCAVQADVANKEMSKWMLWITETFTWMYIGTQDVWAIFIVVLYFSKYGKMKLGKPEDKPEFNDLTYFTMLFAAGIGIGLFYFGVGKSILISMFVRLSCSPGLTIHNYFVPAKLSTKLVTIIQQRAFLYNCELWTNLYTGVNQLGQHLRSNRWSTSRLFWSCSFFPNVNLHCLILKKWGGITSISSRFHE